MTNQLDSRLRGSDGSTTFGGNSETVVLASRGAEGILSSCAGTTYDRYCV